MNSLTFQPAPSVPTHYPLLQALRAARRAWGLARRRQQRAARDRASLNQLRDLSDHQLADIGIARSDLPWMEQRDHFARLLEDLSAYHRHPGVRLPPASRRS